MCEQRGRGNGGLDRVTSTCHGRAGVKELGKEVSGTGTS